MAASKIPMSNGFGFLSKISVGPSSSGSFALPNAFRGLLILNATDAKKGMYIVSTTSAGAVAYSAVLAATGPTISTSTRTLTVNNNSGTTVIAVLMTFEPSDMRAG